MVPTLALFSDIGGGEVVIIGIIALMLFGKNLPAVSRSFGKAFAQFKKGISEATTEIKSEMESAADEVQTMKSEVAASIKVDLRDVEKAETVGENKLSQGGQQALPAQIEPQPKNDEKRVDTAQSLDRAETATRPLIRPAPGTVAAGAVSSAAALDKLEVPPPAKIPPPVEEQ